MRHCICIGSGQKPYAKPFINIDINPKWEPDIVADGASLPMFESNSAEVIVVEHCLEHFQCGEGLGMLRECYRILGSGGSLIVTVPNIRELIKAWIVGKLTTQVFLTAIYGAYMGDPADTHKWGFIPETLAELVSQAGGWKGIEPFNYRPINGASISRDYWILAVEATK